MATTEEYKNGGSASYSFSIEYIKAEDIKVTVDGTALDYTATNPPAQTTEYTVNGSNVIFKQASVSGSTNGGVRIYRETDLGNSDSVTFQPGSSIRAADLNANHKLVRFSAQEKNQEIVTADIRNSAITSAKILDGTIVEGDIANSAITSNKLADNAVTSTEILNGSVTRDKIAADAITGDKIADNAIGTEHLQNDSVRTTDIKDHAVTTAKFENVSQNRILGRHDTGTGQLQHLTPTEARAVLNVENGATADQTASEIKTLLQSDKLTASEIATGALDGRYYTETESDARYFNISSGETIKDGDTFPDNDTTIATTAAINDRIIDLIDDVGGFVPIDNQNSFPTENPDVNNGGGTIVSVKAATTALTAQSGTTLTLPNGRSNGAVIITGVSATIPSGFGFLVETTTTDHTYAFHRLVPKATEVTAVAGKATEIGRLGTADAVADMAILGTADVVADLNTLGTADVVADMNMLATSDVISDMNTLAVTSVINDMDTVAGAVTNVNNVGGSIANVNTTAGSIANVNTVAGSISNVNTVGGAISNVNTTAGSISNVNTVASNISSVNSFANTYRIGANNPTTSLDVGDLFFNTTSDSLKVYTGSAWVDGVTATGNFAVVTGNTFTGSNVHNDNVKSLFGTGSDLQIWHGGTDSYIANGTGNLLIRNNIGTYNGGEIKIQPLTNENSVVAKPNGAAELYWDDDKKLETNSSGIGVTGNITVTGTVDGVDIAAFKTSFDNLSTDIVNDTTPQLGGDLQSNGNDIDFADNDKAVFGTGNDLEIWHSSTSNASIIRHSANVGGALNNLYIDSGQNIILRSHTNGSSHETLANFVKNGAVELYHDGGKRLETTIGGVNVTGELNVTTKVAYPDNAKAIFGTGDDFSIYHDGTNSIQFFDAQVGGVRFRTDIGNSARTNLILGAGVDLYYSNSKKFETTSSGVSVTGQLSTTDTISTVGNLDMSDSTSTGNNRIRLGTGDDLEIFHDGTYNKIESGGNTQLLIRGNGGTIIADAGGNNMIKTIDGGATELYHNGSKKFQTGHGGEYGSFQALNGQNGWDGMSVANNRYVFMGKESEEAVGIWNDHSNEWIMKAIADGKAELYYNGGAKLYTSANGAVIESGSANFEVYSSTDGSDSKITIIGKTGSGGVGQSGRVEIVAQSAQNNTGASNMLLRTRRSNTMYTALHIDKDQNVTLPIDGQRLNFGASNDIQIYHQSNESWIKNNTGTLNILNDGTTQIKNKDDNRTIAQFIQGNACKLYWDNSEKLYTDNGGVAIRGNLYLSTADNHQLLMGANQDFRIFHDGTYNQIYGTGSHPILFFTNSTQRMVLQNDGHLRPASNDTYDLGTSGDRWRNIYTADLQLSNEGKTNDVDGTWGNYTMQEGENDLFLINNRSGKKYKFNLTEVS